MFHFKFYRFNQSLRLLNQDLYINVARRYNTMSKNALLSNALLLDSSTIDWHRVDKTWLHMKQRDFKKAALDIDDNFEEIYKTFSKQNKFSETKTSWNETIATARSVTRYNLKLYRILNKSVGKILDLHKLDSDKIFQEFLSHYRRTKNYQITGLLTVLFTRMFLYSSHLLPDLFDTDNASSITTTDVTQHKVEDDVLEIAECYDLISYGFFFHDTISNLNKSLDEKSTENMFILIGDYFLVQAFKNMTDFGRLNLFEYLATSMVKYVEGESLSLPQKNLTDDQTTSVDLEELEVPKHLSHDQAHSCHVDFITDQSPSIKKLISHCYLTNGYLLANSLKSASIVCNFSPKAQMLAFDFGINLGMAIRISNQLSAHFLHILTDNGTQIVFNTHSQAQTKYPVHHLNVSYCAKFPSTSIEVLQSLLVEYVNRSIRALGAMFDPQFTAQQPHGSLREFGIPYEGVDKILDPSLTSTAIGASSRLSEKSLVLLETLVRIIHEINSFNDHNIRNLSYLRAHQSKG